MEIDTIKKEKYESFLKILDIAIEHDEWIEKVQHQIKNYYLNRKGKIGVKYLLKIARVLKKADHYELIKYLEIDLDSNTQKMNLKNLRSEEFELIRPALTENDIYFYFHFNIDGLPQ